MASPVNQVNVELINRIKAHVKARKVYSVRSIIEAMRSHLSLFAHSTPRNLVKSYVISALYVLVNEEKSLKIAGASLKDTEESLITPTEWRHETRIIP